MEWGCPMKRLIDSMSTVHMMRGKECNRLLCTLCGSLSIMQWMPRAYAHMAVKLCQRVCKASTQFTRTLMRSPSFIEGMSYHLSQRLHGVGLEVLHHLIPEHPIQIVERKVIVDIEIIS